MDRQKIIEKLDEIAREHFMADAMVREIKDQIDSLDDDQVVGMIHDLATDAIDTAEQLRKL